VTTTLTRFTTGEWPVRGTYRRTHNPGAGVHSAVISCPSCGLVGSLSGSHDVRADGEVQPSVVCACGFHEHITLEGYPDG